MELIFEGVNLIILSTKLVIACLSHSVSDDLIGIRECRVAIVGPAEIVLQGTDSESVRDSQDSLMQPSYVVWISTNKLVTVIKK